MSKDRENETGGEVQTYSIYDYNCGAAAHEAFMTAQGLRWSRGAWELLDRKTKDSWVAAALCVMDIQARAALV